MSRTRFHGPRPTESKQEADEEREVAIARVLVPWNSTQHECLCLGANILYVLEDVTQFEKISGAKRQKGNTYLKVLSSQEHILGANEKMPYRQTSGCNRKLRQC